MKFVPNPKSYSEKRLFCLDALRGLDMMLLMAIGPIWRALDEVFHLPEWVMRQHNHYWGGFTLWDIIMPLFIFMCGAAIPFALGRRMEQGRATGVYWKHVAGRVALLWFLGMLCQGRLATLDLMQISPYNNTLQTIAVGYLVAAIVLAVPGKAGRLMRWIVPAGLALGYALLLHFLGDYSKDGNFAQITEQRILSWIVPAGSKAFQTGAYTWFLTSMMFGAMTLCGMNATEILRGEGTRFAKLGKLVAFGAGLLAFGWIVTPWVPMIKHIFTLSFTAQAMGWSVLALAFLYLVNDILMIRRGWGIVLLYGQFALWAYMIGGFFGPGLRATSGIMTQGFPHAFGQPATTVLSSLVTATLLTLCLSVRFGYKEK